MRNDQPTKRLLGNQEGAMEFILTLKPDYKPGIKIRVDVYEAIKSEIVDLMKHEEGVLLQSFFEILHAKLIHMFGEETGWYLYHVKLDLETRSLIKVERSKGRRNIRTIVKMASPYKKEKVKLNLLYS